MKKLYTCLALLVATAVVAAPVMASAPATEAHKAGKNDNHKKDGKGHEGKDKGKDHEDKGKGDHKAGNKGKHEDVEKPAK